jgi:hypothetical protein
MLWILLIVLLFLSVGGYPGWGYHSYGYVPSGLGLVLLIVLLVVLFRGRI